jgi:hypothetical protein
VNHTTETIAMLDTSLAPLRCWRQWRTCRAGRSEGQRAMGPVAIVVSHPFFEDPTEGTLTQGNHSRPAVLGREGRIQTSDLPFPNRARYQVSLLSEMTRLPWGVSLQSWRSLVPEPNDQLRFANDLAISDARVASG